MIHVVSASLLSIPGRMTGIILSLAVFLVFGWLIYKRYEKRLFRNGKTTSKLWTIAGTALMAAVLGYAFCVRWMPSGSVAALAAILGISAQALVGLVAFFLACVAVWGMIRMNLLLCDTANILDETYAPELSITSDQSYCTETKPDKTGWLLCMVLAIGGAIALCNTFPFPAIQPDLDSSVFLYIGREMLRGRIPYVDLFDHKGIVLYFIQCIGLSLSLPGTYSGIWLIELASLLVTVIYMYKIINMLTKSKVTCYLVLLIIVFAYANVYYGGGNFTEEYALPWIAIAVYVYLKFFVTLRFRSSEVVSLGVGCAVIGFLRVNMIGVWVAFTPLVIFFLLKERKYKEIIRCMVCFVGGLTVVCIPLGVYFVLTGSLDDMIKCYIQFNISYAGSNSSAINQLNAILALGSGAHVAAIIFAVMAYRYVGFKKIFWINMWGLAVSLFFASMSGKAYDHYGLVLIPLLVVPVWCAIQAVVHCLEQADTHRIYTRIDRMFRNEWYVAAVIFCLVILTKTVQVTIHANTAEINPVVKYLSEETDESDNTLIIGNSVRCYLESDRKTDNKFFYQIPLISINDTIYEEFLDELNCNPPDYILLYTKELNFSRLKELLDQWCQEGTYIYEDEGSFVVYRFQGS